MNESTITVRYSKALYQVGQEAGKTEAIHKDINLLLDTLKESKEFANLLSSPIVKTSEKVRIFSVIFEGNIEPIVINFFNLLAKNKREQFLFEMCLNYNQLFKAEKGIQEAILTTSIPLNKTSKKEILEFLKKKFKLNIELKEHVNPEIIGGFKLRIDDQQIDASIASKLRKIRTELLNS